MAQDDTWTVSPETTWKFGKHQGVALKDTPLSYILWVAKTFSGGPWKKACRRFIANHHPDLARQNGFKVDEKLPTGGFVQGRMDCSHLYCADQDVPHMIPWDGISPPFDLDDDELSAEFRAIIG